MQIAIPNSTYARDSRSMAILETDRAKVQADRVRSKMLTTNAMVKEEINSIKARLSIIDELQEDMQEIKSLLTKLVK